MRLLTLLPLLAVLSAASQTVIQRTDSLYSAQFETESGVLLEFRKNELVRFNPVTREASIQTIPGIGIMSLENQPLLIQDTLFLVKYGSGLVYRLTGDTLKRIDRSFDHNVMQEAVTFAHRDTIFRFGGRDRWNTYSNLIYFDRATHEWEAVRPIKSKQFPPGMWNNIVHTDGEHIRIFAGFKADPKDPSLRIPNREIWEYQIGKKLWKNLGEFPSSFNLLEEFPNMYPVIDGKDIILFHVHHGVVRIDFRNNRLSVYRLPAKKIHPTTRLFKPFTFEGKFYYFSSFDKPGKPLSAPDEQDFILNEIPIKSLYGAVVTIESLYPANMTYGLIVAGFIICLSTGALIYLRTRGKIIQPAMLTSEGILRKGKLHLLDKDHVALLSVLRDRSNGLSTTDVLEILNLKDQDYSSNTRNKNNRIARLNTELRTVFKIGADLVFEAKSEEDKRLKRYFLRKGYVS